MYKLDFHQLSDEGHGFCRRALGGSLRHLVDASFGFELGWTLRFFEICETVVVVSFTFGKVVADG